MLYQDFSSNINFTYGDFYGWGGHTSYGVIFNFPYRDLNKVAFGFSFTVELNGQYVRNITGFAIKYGNYSNGQFSTMLEYRNSTGPSNWMYPVNFSKTTNQACIAISPDQGNPTIKNGEAKFWAFY